MGLAPSALVLAVGPLAADPALRGALELNGYTLDERQPHSLPEALAGYTALLLNGRGGAADVLAVGRRVSLRPLDDRPLLLYLAPDDSSVARLAGFEHGADVVLGRSAPPAELLAQVEVLERWHKARGQWLGRATEARQINHQLQQAYQQIEQDLKLARRLQASFLPRTLPEVGPVRFAVQYRPCGQVGGDFYDAFRLDEHHVGFYVADAMGHGVPASLLTVFLKKAVQPKEVTGSRYRLVPPDEILARLNRDLIDQQLAQMPFITMVYGLLNCHDGRLQLARAAHPYPLYLPRIGAVQQWQSPGTLLGVFEAEYPVQQRQLHPGDKLILYTDGVSQLGPDGQSDQLVEVAGAHRALAIEPFVERVSQTLLTQENQRDDFTLLAVEVLTG